MRAHLVAIVAACGLAWGCRTSGTRTDAPAIRDALAGIQTTRISLQPPGTRANHYGEAGTTRPSPSEAAIAADLDRLGMTFDPGLSRMIGALCELAPDRANIPSALVDGIASWAGVADPAPRIIVVELPEDPADCAARPAEACRDAFQAVVAEVAASRPAAPDVRYGVGVRRLRSGRTRLMVGVLDKAVHLEPIAVRQRAGARIELAGRLVGDRRRPSIEVSLPSGGFRSVPVRETVGSSFTAAFACDAGDGAYQIEVLADGEHGPEVTANFPVFCGVAPPARIAAEVETVAPGVSPDDVALANFHFLARERQARGLGPLVWDDRAAAVAEAHSRDMQRHGFVGHVSPTTGDVAARMGRAGVDATIVRENVARGYGPAGIHDSLMRSPGHRVNMLARDVPKVGIRVGIGASESNVAGAPRPVFLTQVFFRPPGAGAPEGAAMVPALRAAVDRRRADLRLGKIAWDPRLDPIATSLAKAHARGRPMPREFADQAFALGYREVETHVIVSADFDALASIELWRGPSAPIGIGIVRTGSRDAGRFVMIVLVGQR